MVEYGPNGRRVTYKVTKYKVDPSHKLIKRLKTLVGDNNVRLQRIRNNQTRKE